MLMASEVSKASIEIVRSSGLPAVVTCKSNGTVTSYPDSRVWGTKCLCKRNLETAIQTDTLERHFRTWAGLPKGSYWFLCESVCYHDMKYEFKRHMDDGAYRRNPPKWHPEPAYN